MMNNVFQDFNQNSLQPAENEIGIDDVMPEFGIDDSMDLSGDIFGEVPNLDLGVEEQLTNNETGLPSDSLQNSIEEDTTVDMPLGSAPEQPENEFDEAMPPAMDIQEDVPMQDVAPVEEELSQPDMFQETENTEAVSAASADTAVITAGMSITGDISSSGNMDVIGNITGNIEILGKLNVTGSITGNSSAAEIYAEAAHINGEIRSKSSVKIGQNSMIFGNIFATSAVIAGAVNGDIDVNGPVILDKSAIVMGNIKSKSVQINNGAIIEGMCSQCYADISAASFFDEVRKNRK